MRTVFTLGNGAVHLTASDITGVVSCIIWCLVIIVTIKYVGFVLRADHDGVGGILALSTLVRANLRNPRAIIVVAMLGVFGASLFFGDSVITPAISVMSAIEGLKVAFPTMPNLVVPLSLAVLTALFWAQRYGTSGIGKVFGPVMALWFACIAGAGIPHIVTNPRILIALSPTEGALFVYHHPLVSFLALSAIVLSVSGAEALYADVSHFGRKPIQIVWIGVVMPALILNYLGQGALLIDDPSAITHPFFHLVPAELTVPFVFLATLATLIASQAVISGAYSMAKQASQLGYLPHMTVVHTSAHSRGQIYLPVVNGLLYVAVASVIVAFGSSEGLSSAYGLAISMDFVITTALMCVLTRTAWAWPIVGSLAFGAGLSVVEWPILAANATKLVSGGWLPLSIACLLMFLMTTWKRGEVLVTEARREKEGPLARFLTDLERHPVPRIPGTVVYPHSMTTTVPSSLRFSVEAHHVLHEHVVIVSLKSVPVPYAPTKGRVTFDKLQTSIPGIVHMTVRFGFMERRDLDEALCKAEKDFGLGQWKVAEARLMLSHLEITASDSPSMVWWRKRIFVWMTRLSASPQWILHLPPDRTTEITTRIAI